MKILHDCRFARCRLHRRLLLTSLWLVALPFFIASNFSLRFITPIKLQHIELAAASPIHTREFNCGCPCSCDADALAWKNKRLPFSCQARIHYLMRKYDNSHSQACSAAVRGGACGVACDPVLCVHATRNDNKTLDNVDTKENKPFFVPPQTSSWPTIATSNSHYNETTKEQRKWPQMDDRVPNAILNGFRFGEHANQTKNDTEKHYEWNGTLYEKPIQSLATIVTAYYDIKSKHPAEQYKSWFENLLGATDPMIIFLEPNETAWIPWIPWFQERRHHAPTIIVPFPFSNLTMSTTFTNAFWKEVMKRDYGHRYKKGVDVYKIWNEKIIMLHEAAAVNPFETDHFFWMDAGYFRRRAKSPRNRPVIQNNISANGVLPRRILVQNIFKESSRQVIAAGAWGGTGAAIQEAYDRYFETFQFMVKNDVTCVGYEQLVLIEMCRTFTSLCCIQYSGEDGDWFAMGRDMLPNPQTTFYDSFELNRTGHKLVRNTSMLS